MRLQKEIEFPLFHLGTVPDSTGKPVTFTPELLREMEKNSNFVARSGILQAPVKYDHPAFGAPDKENHGKMIRYQVRNNSLFAIGTNWSERLQADKAREARIAYSPEFVSEFSYIDPVTNQTVKLGPTVVGLAMLGGDRPAIKNLRPVAQFEFGENVGPADAFLMREELQNSGMVSEYCEDARYFAEVQNNAARFFSETRKEEQTMTDAEIAALLDSKIAAATAPLVAANKKLEDANTALQGQLKSFSETSKREAEVHSFCETIAKTKPTLNKLSMDRLEKKILLHPDMTPALDAEVRAFVEGLSAVVLKGDPAKKPDGTGDDDTPTDEPKALAAVRPKHFAERSKNEGLLSQAIADLKTYKPKLFSEAKATTLDQQFAVTKQYVIEREAAAN